MRARLRSWWQKRSNPLIVVAITTVVVGVLALVICGYLLRLAWTGFFNRTLWDWLQLLIVPLVLALIALVFQLANSRTERQLAKQRYEQDQQIAKQRYEQDQQIARDKQREDLLQTYLDRMSELLLKEQLRSSAVDAEVRNVARVRTITLLFQLDARRIGYVFAFLREAGLMSTTPNDSIVSLKDAHLEKINFSQANLTGADLTRAHLTGAHLSGAHLSGAHLYGAGLYRAHLSDANLSGADLSDANLSGADLSGAHLYGANLSGADLSRAVVTEEQLKKAKSLEGATIPDGVYRQKSPEQEQSS